MDPKTRLVYFFNRNTGQTQWTPPEVPVEGDEAPIVGAMASVPDQPPHNGEVGGADGNGEERQISSIEAHIVVPKEGAGTGGEAGAGAVSRLDRLRRASRLLIAVQRATAVGKGESYGIVRCARGGRARSPATRPAGPS